VPDDGTAGDKFGISVDISGNIAIIGARYDDDKGSDSGSAYIYQRDLNDNSWVLLKKLVPNDGAADDQFGCSVAVSGDTFLVGALYDDDKQGDDSGSAYIFHQ